uniref:hypothetical protein n=1 Tax=Pararhizobium sp. IMCC3301 TaxID=3067904 RepID=UPI002740B7C2|nr:hypothetical protein [Pararhizobium sp. IMCC3301]
MARHTNPADAWKLGFDSWRMISEAQYVVALRLAGMSGLWHMQPNETARMVSEKNAAFTQSAAKALIAASSGARPDQIAAAALAPVRKKTASNVKRLTRAALRNSKL